MFQERKRNLCEVNKMLYKAEMIKQLTTSEL